MSSTEHLPITHRAPLRHTSRSPPAPARNLALRVTVFVVGASSLGAEIAAARLRGDLPGLSTVVMELTDLSILQYATGRR